MWINEQGRFYIGDCATGDRAATPEEVVEWEVARERTRIDSISVTPWQFRKALNIIGLREAAEAAVAAASQDVKDGYEFATEIRRSDPLVIQMATTLGKTPSEMDDFFLLAETL